jgi:hypothetical protein
MSAEATFYEIGALTKSAKALNGAGTAAAAAANLQEVTFCNTAANISHCQFVL